MNTKLMRFITALCTVFTSYKKALRAFIISALLIIPTQSIAQIYDVIIVGGGISGLAAAHTLQERHQSVLILEARDRIGGRIWSVNPWGTTLDLGASWLHGINNNPLYPIIKKASIETIPTTYSGDDIKKKLGDMVIYNDRGEKIPDSQVKAAVPLLLRFDKFVASYPDKSASLKSVYELFIQKNNLSGQQLQIFRYQVLSNYVYEYAEDFDNFSIQIDTPYDNTEVSGEQVIFPKGYSQILPLLSKNLPIKLNQIVTKINYEKPIIEVETQNAKYQARAVIITVPVSVLNAKKIDFTPALPEEKTQAFAQIKMGTYDKIFLNFKEVFWDKKAEWIGFIQPIPEKYPVFDIMNYYKFSQQPILIVFNAGKQAEQYEKMPDQQIINNIMEELRLMYGKDIPDPLSYVITRWHNDPFSLGSYSHLSRGEPLKEYHILGKPVANRLFFAGEATSLTDPATVHGAYLTGIRAAEEVESVLKSLK